MKLLGAIVIVLITFLTGFYGYFKYSIGYWTSKCVAHDEPKIPYAMEGNEYGNANMVTPKALVQLSTYQWLRRIFKTNTNQRVQK